MTEYSKVNVKLSDSELNKLTSPAKDQTGVMLRINNKVLGGCKWPQELLLTTR